MGGDEKSSQRPYTGDRNAKPNEQNNKFTHKRPNEKLPKF